MLAAIAAFHSGLPCSIPMACRLFWRSVGAYWPAAISNSLFGSVINPKPARLFGILPNKGERGAACPSEAEGPLSTPPAEGTAPPGAPDGTGAPCGGTSEDCGPTEPSVEGCPF